MSVLDDYIATEYVQERIVQAGEKNFTCPAAEESILRRMFKDRNVAEDVVNDLSGKDFSNVDYGRIFNAIQRLVEKQRGIDMITVEDAIGNMFPKNAKRLKELAVVLTKYTGYNEDDARNIADHVKIVKDLSARRQAIKSFEQLMNDLHNPAKEIGATLTALGEAADGVDVSDVEFNGTGEVMMGTYDYVDKLNKGEMKSITTGIGNLDRLIGGFFAGELTIIAARPSVGKTAFGMNVAISAAHKGFKVCFVSCEMGLEGVGQRLFANLAWVNGMAIRKAELKEDEWSRMADAMSEGGDLPITWVFNTNAIEDVAKMVSRKARRGEIDILIVDYLQFMDCHKQFKEERHRIGYISHALKQIARTANIPVIALAQVTREGEGVMPSMKMLRESGNIEQDADGIIFLHRPSSADDKTIDPRDKPYFEEYGERGMVYLCIGVAKQRNGAVGQACVIFEPEYMRYVEIDRTGAA